MKHRTLLLWSTLVALALVAAMRRRSPSTLAGMTCEPWTLRGSQWSTANA